MRLSLVKKLLLMFIVVFAFFGLTMYTKPQLREANDHMGYAKATQKLSLLNAVKMQNNEEMVPIVPNLSKTTDDRKVISKAQTLDPNSQKHGTQVIDWFSEFHDLRTEYANLYKSFEEVAVTIFKNPFQDFKTKNDVFEKSYDLLKFRLFLKKALDNLNKITDASSNYYAALNCYNAVYPFRQSSFWIFSEKIYYTIPNPEKRAKLLGLFNKISKNTSNMTDFCVNKIFLA